MLGEQIGEERGKVELRRVLRSKGPGPAVEVTFRASGKLLGVDHMDLGTYSSTVRPDGFLYGEGQGVLRGKGGEMASWVGQGVGRFTPGGGISYRGAIYIQSASPAFQRLNGIAVLFEHEVDAHDNLVTKLFEWK
jgi:hypothetical protein